MLFHAPCRINTRGFTLVETLVAISILLAVIIGPMTIAQRGMQSSYFAGEQITAIYLAQEAIEHFQRLRDDAALESFDDYKDGVNSVSQSTRRWHTSLASACKDSDGCDYNFETGAYVDCTSTSACLLDRITSSARLYGHGGSTVSKFTRRVVVGNFDALGGVPVTVTITWTPGNTSVYGATKSVVIQTYIYDHYSRFES